LSRRPAGYERDILLVKTTFVFYNPPMRDVVAVDDPRAVQSLAQPARIAMLEALTEPLSAASLARVLGEPRQRVNYHLKELERAGLVRHAGERRKGNFVEQLYEAAARRFVVSPRVGRSPESLERALRDHLSLANLVRLGERLQLDAAALLDRAAFDGGDVPSAALEAEVRFPSPEARSAFMTEYLQLIGPLLKKHGAASGEPFRLATAIYPDLEGHHG
jgi:DNA-binding transcriptional ArsR family regulator